MIEISNEILDMLDDLGLDIEAQKVAIESIYYDLFGGDAL